MNLVYTIFGKFNYSVCYYYKTGKLLNLVYYFIRVTCSGQYVTYLPPQFGAYQFILHGDTFCTYKNRQFSLVLHNAHLLFHRHQCIKSTSFLLQ